MNNERIYKMPFSKVYFLLIKKAERKGYNKSDVDQLIYWLTGYDSVGLQKQIDYNVDYETFFNEAPNININANKIKGIICGYRVEEIKDPLIQKIRWLDKLIDELVRGKQIDKIMRS